MLLVININNTNTMLGLFHNQKWIANWRVSSDRAKLVDEYGMLLKNLFDFEGYKWEDVSAIAIASVVPPLTTTFTDMSRQFFKRNPLVVSHEINLGVKVRTDYPAEVGADRILNALATHRLHGSPAIVVDFGTATTFDAISAEGDYLGGAIAPGLGIAAEALFSRTAKLPRIELVAPPAAIGPNTIQCMQSGLVLGYVGLIEGLVKRIRAELGGKARVIGTGGLAPVLAKETKVIEVVDQMLTLEGLRLIYELNQEDSATIVS
jgi:type III pantothenate kinase